MSSKLSTYKHSPWTFFCRFSYVNDVKDVKDVRDVKDVKYVKYVKYLYDVKYVKYVNDVKDRIVGFCFYFRRSEEAA